MGGNDNFQARVQQERDCRMRKEVAKREAREKKLSDWQQKETERMAAFKQMMIAQGCTYLGSESTGQPAPSIGPARPF
jgi:hypothetical protein